jgi:plasmid stability protein
MQYTIRNVPDYLDAALRGSAREKGKSLNEAAIEALARGVGLSGRRHRQRDLGDVAGSWIEDPPFERALAEQDTVDKEMWPSLRNPRKPSRKKAAPSIPARQKRPRVRAAA